MKRRAGFLCMGLGMALILSALFLLLHNYLEAQNAASASAQVVEALTEVQQSEQLIVVSSVPTVEADTAEAVTPAPVSEEPEEEAELPETDSSEMLAVEIDGYEYIGTLSLPSLSLELPVMAQWSYEGLKIAPGRYSGAIGTGDLVICGHNYAGHFANLKYIQVGDTVTFTDVTGVVTTYTVDAVETLSATAVEDMTAGEWPLTIFTCTVGGQARVAVRCVVA